MNYQLLGLAGVAFLTPIAIVQLYDFLSNWNIFSSPRSSKRSLLSKYSVIDEDNSSSIDLPESAAVSTWNSIGLERPMVIAMVSDSNEDDILPLPPHSPFFVRSSLFLLHLSIANG
jgi:hypothetical protein